MTERFCIRRIRNQKGESGKEESRNADIGRANSNKCDGGNNSISEMRQEQSPEEEEVSSQNTAYAWKMANKKERGQVTEEDEGGDNNSSRVIKMEDSLLEEGEELRAIYSPMKGVY